MSEEEAIIWAKALLQDKEKYAKYHSWVGTNTFVSIQILLNLIEELKGITKNYDSYIGEKMPLNSKIIIADREYFMNGTFVNKFVSKDKIRKEIAETEEKLYNGEIMQRIAYIKIETLKELLEE